MKTVQMVAIEKVRVINSRARSEVKFKELVGNIAKVGLKRPITVSPREDSPDNSILSAAREGWRPVSPSATRRSPRSSWTRPCRIDTS